MFLIGVIATLAGWRRPINQGLLAWLVLDLLLGSVLMDVPAAFHRILGVLPAALLMVAIGIDTGATVLARSGSWSPRVATWLAAIGVLVLAVVDVHYYFGIYNRQQAYKPPTQETISIIAQEYSRMKQGTFVIFTRDGIDAAGKVHHTPIVYVADDAIKGGVPQVVDKLDKTRSLFFYVLPDQAAELPRLMARSPGGTLQQYHRSIDGFLLMTRYAVPPGTQ